MNVYECNGKNIFMRWNVLIRIIEVQRISGHHFSVFLVASSLFRQKYVVFHRTKTRIGSSFLDEGRHFENKFIGGK
jgi:hypothetical protein